MEQYRSVTQARGVTLVELLVVIACLAILLPAGFSGYASWQQQRQLEQLVQQVHSDILRARQSVLMRQTVSPLTIRFFPGEQWCYRITDQRAASCTGCAADCGVSGGIPLPHGRDSQDWPGIQLTEVALPGQTLGFDARRGGMTAGSLRFSSPAGNRRLVMSGYGRIRVCGGATEGETNLC